MTPYHPAWHPWQKRIAFVVYRVADVLAPMLMLSLLALSAYIALVLP